MARLLNQKDLSERARKIKNIILDIDGVLTDGKIYVSAENVETLAFNVRDGLGIVRAQEFDIEFWVITGRSSMAVTHRMNDLKVQHVYKGVTDKMGKFEELLKEGKLSEENTAYIGDDVIDLPLLKRVGLSATVADCHQDIVGNVHWVSSKNGGNSAVRELIDLILAAQGKRIQF